MACLQRARAGLSVIKLQILYHNKLFIRGQVTVIGCVDMQSCADIILCLIYCTVGHNAMLHVNLRSSEGKHAKQNVQCSIDNGKHSTKHLRFVMIDKIFAIDRHLKIYLLFTFIKRFNIVILSYLNQQHHC